MLNIIYKYGFYILKNVEYKTNDLNYYINNKQKIGSTFFLNFTFILLIKKIKQI